ncbi:MAG: hypothetical protein ACYDCP_07025 [Thermoplasmataceae archaeon]
MRRVRCCGEYCADPYLILCGRYGGVAPTATGVVAGVPARRQ